MRHVRFRGKLLKGKGLLNAGDWIEGGYYRDDCYGGCPEGKHFIISFNSAFGGFNDMTEVDGKTVGEWTGLRDKNGKEVYEGDIITCSHGCPHTVEWVQEYGGTFVGGMPAFYLSGLREGYAWTGAEEVMGNIYEHPHLLERSDSTESAQPKAEAET